MNVDVDEHPLELVEQLEWRDQAPGDPGNPFLRETTPFDWDIQGRGHPLRFPKDPYGTGGALVAAWLKINISQPKDDRIFQNKNLNPNNAKLDPTTNSYQCQSRQSYSAHSLRRLAWRNFSQTEGDIEPSTWASTQTVAVAVGSSSSQSSFGEINAHFYVGVM